MIEDRKSLEKFVKKNAKRIDGIYMGIGENYSRFKTVKVKDLKRALNQAIAIAKIEKDKVQGHICWNDDVVCSCYVGFKFVYYT